MRSLMVKDNDYERAKVLLDMSMNQIPPGALDVAVQTARGAGEILREKLGLVTIEYKGTVDLVTDADRASETLIADEWSGRRCAVCLDRRSVGRHDEFRAWLPPFWSVDRARAHGERHTRCPL